MQFCIYRPTVIKVLLNILCWGWSIGVIICYQLSSRCGSSAVTDRDTSVKRRGWHDDDMTCGRVPGAGSVTEYWRRRRNALIGGIASGRRLAAACRSAARSQRSQSRTPPCLWREVDEPSPATVSVSHRRRLLPWSWNASSGNASSAGNTCSFVSVIVSVASRMPSTCESEAVCAAIGAIWLCSLLSVHAVSFDRSSSDVAAALVRLSNSYSSVKTLSIISVYTDWE